MHDIGKNLVDIILTNNGYDVVNIGIKQPVSAIVDAATEHGADVVGMSGLLVKSTVVMMPFQPVRAELPGPRGPLAGAARRGRAHSGPAWNRTWPPCSMPSEVRYARDAFEGLRLMDAFMAVKRGEAGAELPPMRERRVATGARLQAYRS